MYLQEEFLIIFPYKTFARAYLTVDNVATHWKIFSTASA